MQMHVNIFKLHIIESQEHRSAWKKSACGRQEDFTKLTHMEIHMYVHKYINIYPRSSEDNNGSFMSMGWPLPDRQCNHLNNQAYR